MPKCGAQSDRPGRIDAAAAGWLITVAFAAARTLPWLLRPGMFFDGELYAGISRNMALGIGDAWHPVFSATMFADYREAPPLAFVLQSLMFRLLGDHFWVEKLYSLLTGLATAAVIVAIWRRLVDASSPWRSYSWLPVLLWITLPGWMQVYGNNLLEGTMGLFAILAVYAVLRASEGGRAAFAWLPLAAASVVAALLSKGPVGLYPLVTPVVAGLTLRRPQGLGKSAAMNAALVGLFCVAIGLALLPAGALEGFATYLRVQVIAAVAGQREHTASALGRFYIFSEILRELAISALVTGGLVLWSKRHSSGSDSKDAARNRAIAFCLLIGLCGSLPIAISPKQSAYYAFPSYAFYALTLALWCAPALVRIVAAVSSAADSRGRLLRKAALCALLVLLGAVLCKSLRHPQLDRVLYDDVLALARVVPKSSVISVQAFSGDLHGDIAFPFYLGRWSSISTDNRAPHEFLVLPIAVSMQPPPGYVEAPPQMRLYRLFKRTDSVNLATEPTALNPDTGSVLQPRF